MAEEKKPMSKGKIAAIVIIVLVVLAAIGNLTGGNNNQQQTQTTTEQPAAEQKAEETPAAETAWDASSLVGKTIETAWDDIEAQGYTIKIVSTTGSELNSDESNRHTSTTQSWRVADVKQDDKAKTVTVTADSADHFVKEHGESALVD